MDFCRNISLPSGLPSDFPPENSLPPVCSKLEDYSAPLDDLFPSHNQEGDLEWLSIFVEDCLTSSGKCIPPPPNPPNPTLQPQKPSQETHQTPLSLTVPGKKARSKRKRTLTKKMHESETSSMLDPPLLNQAHWLADSELIVPIKNHKTAAAAVEEEEEEQETTTDTEEEKIEWKDSWGGSRLEAAARRCTHCLSHRTPQWRTGPLGPKTLCNACGVRFKSGRLLPEYRPAKSPTFVSYKHSNSHRKVMEMRNTTHSH